MYGLRRGKLVVVVVAVEKQETLSMHGMEHVSTVSKKYGVGR